MWSDLKIVHGKSPHSQNQNSVERANQDTDILLEIWEQDSKTKMWSEGLKCIQLMKNRAFQCDI